jgi:4-alpha-glucanotransferase
MPRIGAFHNVPLLMSSEALHRLAALAGVAVDWSDYRGHPQRVQDDSLRRVLEALELRCGSEAQIADSLARLQAEEMEFPPLITATQGQLPPWPRAVLESGPAKLLLEDGTVVDLPAGAVPPPIHQPGYHRLLCGGHQMTVAVAPPMAYRVEDGRHPAGRRPWGLAAQLYSLRGGGGIGDFSALAELARHAALQGADALAISPVHALFAADTGRFSPYSPSSRLFLNALHVDPAAVFGRDAVESVVAAMAAQTEFARLEASDSIEWPTVARMRMRVLRALYEQFRSGAARDADDPLTRELQEFRVRCGEALEDHARFEALHAWHLTADPEAWHWRRWPEAMRDPRNAAVAEFAAQSREVDFHVFLQWLADKGLGLAQASARDAGMSIGLIADLAIGTDGGGSHAWSRQRQMLTGLSVGAPPDLLNRQGQNWGLTTFSPRALRRHGYAAFLELLRASLRHAGGLRIDHVLGLQRLWLVPEGAPPGEGAYLRYPMDDLLRLVALESWRHRAVIVGEDLGTVPEGLRERLAQAGILGMRVLWFETDHGFYVEPSRWPRNAMATTTTHDLPTVAGWWSGRDIDWRAKLSQLPPGHTEQAEREQRDGERRRLWDAFLHAGVTAAPMPPPEQTERVVDAAIRFVARTPSPLAIVPLEDLCGLVEQPNLPGVTDPHPNWQRRLPQPVEQIFAAASVAERLQALREERDGGDA